MQDEAEDGVQKDENSLDLGAPPVRKPYRKPVLYRFGSVRELTKAVTSKGAHDGRPGRRTGRGGLQEEGWALRGPGRLHEGPQRLNHLANAA